MEQEPRTALERALLLLRASLVPGWQPTVGQGLVWAIRCAVGLAVLALVASAVDKTLWDWLKLLIVPAVLAVGGYLFTRSENRRTQEVAERRTRDEALQAYLDQMGQMLLDKERPLRRSKEDDEERTLARARTLTVLPRLDGGRKGTVLRFLYESGLIHKDGPIIDLRGADFSAAHLEHVQLPEAHLRLTNLEGAHVGGTSLRKANLVGAKLKGAILAYESPPDPDGIRSFVGATLQEATLQAADLQHVDSGHTTLDGADLFAAEVTEEQLAACASLEGATMPNGQRYEDWLKCKNRGEGAENSGAS